MIALPSKIFDIVRSASGQQSANSRPSQLT